MPETNLQTIIQILYYGCMTVLVGGFLVLLIKTHWRFANDKLNSKELSFEWLVKLIEKFPILKFLAFDKLQHFAGGLILGFIFGLQKGSYFAWGWEVKDALIPYEKAGRWGGDGFSYKDGLFTQAGVLLGSFLSILAGVRNDVI